MRYYFIASTLGVRHTGHMYPGTWKAFNTLLIFATSVTCRTNLSSLRVECTLSHEKRDSEFLFPSNGKSKLVTLVTTNGHLVTHKSRLHPPSTIHHPPSTMQHPASTGECDVQDASSLASGIDPSSLRPSCVPFSPLHFIFNCSNIFVHGFHLKRDPNCK